MHRPRRPFWIRSLPAITGQLTEGTDLVARTLIHHYPGMTGTLAVFQLALDREAFAHELHTHAEGEIVIVLSGALELLVADSVNRLDAGGFYYNPPGVLHTVRSVGSEPASFLAVRIDTTEPGDGPAPNASLFLHDPRTLRTWSTDQTTQRQRLCEDHPLASGGVLTVDRVRIAAHTRFPTHAHDHDVLYVLLTGVLHGLGHPTPAPALIYYPAGTPHGISAASPEPIEMLVFEFHNPAL